MKKLIAITTLLITSTLTGCFSSGDKQETITDSNYIKLIELLNNPVMNNGYLLYTIYGDTIGIQSINSLFVINEYSLTLTKQLKQYSHIVDSTTIEEKDILSNTTSTYMNNVNIASLDHFSELILDSYSNEFSYYSMKDFIPLALELTEVDGFTYFLDNTSFEEYQYRLSGTINTSKIDSDLNSILEDIVDGYDKYLENSELEITITFKTNVDNTYFKPEFNFTINETEIIKIT